MFSFSAELRKICGEYPAKIAREQDAIADSLATEIKLFIDCELDQFRNGCVWYLATWSAALIKQLAPYLQVGCEA